MCLRVLQSHQRSLVHSAGPIHLGKVGRSEGVVGGGHIPGLINPSVLRADCAPLSFLLFEAPIRNVTLEALQLWMQQGLNRQCVTFSWRTGSLFCLSDPE